jgi:hypothetical protein
MPEASCQILGEAYLTLRLECMIFVHRRSKFVSNRSADEHAGTAP